MNVSAATACLLRVSCLVLFAWVGLGCERADATREHAVQVWQKAIAAADADPEVQRLAAAAKDAEIDVQDARARLGRREQDVLDAPTAQAQQEALTRAVERQGRARAAHDAARKRSARASLSAEDLAMVDAALGGETGAAAAAGGASARKRIAVIPKGTTQVFWKSVEAGAREAAAAEGLEVVWKGPITEDDRAQQVQLVQQFATEGVAGIVLAPLDAKALLAPVRAARAKGIPVVVFDSALDGEVGKDFASFVATDNEAAGHMAGAAMAELTGGKGNIVMLRNQVGSASTEARERGFVDELAKHADMKLTVDNRYGGASIGEAKTEALNLVDRLREAQGVFCCNELTTHGMLLALQQEGLAGKLQFVGFDASPVLVKGVETGAIRALVVQNPKRMGREAVQQMAMLLRGETVAPRIDTGVALVDKDGLGKPEIQALLR
ncbi:MAG: substrate-binding domain-containing protein [Planctomycetota bacterium]